VTSSTMTAMRELDSRTADGLHVQLLWCETSDRVFVSVSDSRTGNEFSVQVPHGQRARHVFEHPYAYLA
jgi:hypothetical protein